MAKAKSDATDLVSVLTKPGQWLGYPLLEGDTLTVILEPARYELMPNGGQVEVDGQAKQPNASIVHDGGTVNIKALSGVWLEIRRLEPINKHPE